MSVEVASLFLLLILEVLLYAPPNFRWHNNKIKKMKAVTQAHQALINGCLGCHNQFKDKVSTALK